MRLSIKKGEIRFENCHKLLQKSITHFLARKKPSIFTYREEKQKNEDYFEFDFFVSYDQIKHTQKEIRTLISGFKKDWNENVRKTVGCSISGLKERGWTNAAIKKYLKEPDAEVDNPHYKCAPKMKIYSIERIEKVEDSEEWMNWYNSSLEKRRNKSISAQKAIKTRKENLIKQIEEIEIEIPKFRRERLYENAINHYNWLALSRNKDMVLLENCDFKFLNRITVNYLRHDFNHYDYLLEGLSGEVGKTEAYVLLKNKILKKIAERYDFLKYEAMDQCY
jgi:hypothetical protein